MHDAESLTWYRTAAEPSSVDRERWYATAPGPDGAPAVDPLQPLPVPRRPQVTYDPSFCDLIVELGAQGASRTEMLHAIGCSWSAWYGWIERHPDFADAVEQATIAAQAWWEVRGRQGAMGQLPGFNAPAWSFTMARRFRADYTERTELTGANGAPLVNPIDFSSLTADERAALRLVLERRLAPTIDADA